MDKELQKTTLRVAIIADNYNMAEFYYMRFIEDNRDQILISGNQRSVLSDGTIIEKCSVNDVRAKCMHIDQVILCLHDAVTLEQIGCVLDILACSQVPQSYWFMCYEEDEND